MPEAVVFEVRCKGCGRSLMTVERLRDPEIGLGTGHLPACSSSEPLGDAPMLGEIMADVRITRLRERGRTGSAHA